MLNYCQSKVAVPLFTVDTYGLIIRDEFSSFKYCIYCRRVLELPKWSSANELYATHNIKKN